MMRMNLVRLSPRTLRAGLCCGAIAAQALAAPPAGYMDYAALSKAVHDLAASSSNCHVDVLGQSVEKRDLLLLTLSSDQNEAAKRPALLITAGLDARHRVGTETALRVAQRLLKDHADLLNAMTVYVIPCVNPDGMERNAGPVNYGHIGNLRPVDEDRDGAVDEDGPQDLNGDGVITMMRRVNPPLDDTATMMADPAEPRLLKKPDAEKGERAVYSIYIEGLDVDGDGKIAEDGPGGIDLDKNFMHRWPEHDIDAGPFQLSEPESAAIAKFVIDHRNIVEAITYGRHDNLVNVPDSRPKDVTGEAPKDLDGDDAGYYKEIAKLFKETTGQERAPQNDIAGAFEVWLYAQRGIPSFATVVWGRPEASKPPETKPAETKPAETKPADLQPDSQPATKPAINMGAVADASSNGPEDIQQPQQPPPGGGGGRPRRGRPPGAGPPAAPRGENQPGENAAGEKKDKDSKPKPADPEAAAWLEYSDRDRNHEGFIEWKPFDHPSLGNVEIGGFVPGFQMNPPADQLDALADKQTAFAVALMGKRPKIATEGPVVKKLAGGLYEVRFGLNNDGYLPTATAIARKARSFLPTVVRLSTPIEQIMAGDRVSKVWGVTGGERWSHRWILRVDDGSEIKIELNNPQLGNQTITFKAEQKP